MNTEELKFKVCAPNDSGSPDGNKIYDCLSIDFEERVVEIKTRTRGMRWICIEDVMMLPYSGCKDKNGYEIYEGDILSVPFKGKIVAMVVRFGNIKGIECYPISWYLVEYPNEGVDTHNLSSYASNSVIIGNIYEGV